MSKMVTIKESTLSAAWAKAFLAVMTPGCSEITPLIVTVTRVDVEKFEGHSKLRQAVDSALQARGLASSQTVANTIFPQSLWNPLRERGLLYKRYIEHAWPRVKKCRANHRGTYFQRLIAFENGENPVNQLEHVISTWKNGNHRHSALQLSVFDPRHDHTDCRQMGFPCLHQVCFSPMGSNGIDGLAVTGFYATQHIFEKAYGNYLGLSRLGHFAAHEMGLRLVRMTCIAACAKLGNVEKGNLTNVADVVRQSVETGVDNN